MNDILRLTYCRTIPGQATPIRVTKYFADMDFAKRKRDEAKRHMDTLGEVELTRWQFVEVIE